MICNYLYAKAYDKPMGFFWAFHDIIILILTVLLQVFGIYYAVKVQILEGEDEEVIM